MYVKIGISIEWAFRLLFLQMLKYISLLLIYSYWSQASCLKLLLDTMSFLPGHKNHKGS